MNSTRTNHPDAKQLQAFLEGRLTESDRTAVECHVDVCDECCSAMANMPLDTLSCRLQDIASDADEPTVAASLNESQAANEPDCGIPHALVDHPRYRILEPLGRGGMGVVYKAEHRMMDRIVALKVIDGRLIENPQAVERFRNEVKAAGKLTHANIVSAFDAEQAGDSHFLVMEFVDGISLAELVRRNGPLSVDQACGIVRKVAHGLHHAFQQGMVHRDIKPQNIMVTTTGKVRILDFGLARLAHDRQQNVAPSEEPLETLRRTADALTLVGTILGTPDYIAPEQVTDAHRADTRADIYSLGCTFYFLLIGHPPFPRGSALDKLVAHTDHKPTPIADLRADVQADVVEIIDRMTEKQPAFRFQTPMDVATAIDAFLQRAVPVSATLIDQPADDTVADRPASNHSAKTIATIDLPAANDTDFVVSRYTTSNPLSDFDVDPPVVVPPRRQFARRRATISVADDPDTPQPKRIAVGPLLIAVGGVVALGLIFVLNDGETTPSSDTGTVTAPSVVAPDDAPVSPTPTANISDATESATEHSFSVPRDDREWIELIPQMIPESDAIAGVWRRIGSEVHVESMTSARSQLPFKAPDEYDFEVTFTRHDGVHSIALIFTMNGHQAAFDVDAWGEHLAGIQMIDGQTIQFGGSNPTRVTGQQLTNGQRYTARVHVRRGHVDAFVDGERLTTYHGDGRNLSLISLWELPDTQTIGVGAYEAATTFHSIRVRPVGTRP